MSDPALRGLVPGDGWWRKRDGSAVRLSEMMGDHLRNVLVMIDRTSRPTRLFVSKRQEILCEMLRRSAAEVELKSIRF
jgi:hypothetical protein